MKVSAETKLERNGRSLFKTCACVPVFTIIADIMWHDSSVPPIAVGISILTGSSIEGFHVVGTEAIETVS